MKIDEGRRELLEKKKETERQDAIKKLFSEEATTSNEDETNDITQPLSDHNPKAVDISGQTDETSQKQTINNQKPTKKVNEIWDETSILSPNSQTETMENPNSFIRKSIPQLVEGESQDIVRKPKVIPGVRNGLNQESIKLDFTEKIFPTLALRESQFKEAPAPKLRKLAKKMDQVGVYDAES